MYASARVEEAGVALEELHPPPIDALPVGTNAETPATRQRRAPAHASRASAQRIIAICQRIQAVQHALASIANRSISLRDGGNRSRYALSLRRYASGRARLLFSAAGLADDALRSRGAARSSVNFAFS